MRVAKSLVAGLYYKINVFCLLGQPDGTANGGSMDTWESAGFTILDSGYDIWIKKMRNAFRWRSAFSYYLVPVAVIYFWFWVFGLVYQYFCTYWLFYLWGDLLVVLLVLRHKGRFLDARVKMPQLC